MLLFADVVKTLPQLEQLVYLVLNLAHNLLADFARLTRLIVVVLGAEDERGELLLELVVVFKLFPLLGLGKVYDFFFELLRSSILHVLDLHEARKGRTSLRPPALLLLPLLFLRRTAILRRRRSRGSP